jgi:hypothetical protein
MLVASGPLSLPNSAARRRPGARSARTAASGQMMAPARRRRYRPPLKPFGDYSRDRGTTRQAFARRSQIITCCQGRAV